MAELDDLTCDQEIFVALVASEQLRMQIQLAGGEVPPREPRKSKKKSSDDPYGAMLEQNRRQRDLQNEFAHDEKMLEKCTKPL